MIYWKRLMKWITYKATITILLIYILMQGIYHGARSATTWIYYMCQNKHTRQKSLRKYMRCWRSRLARLNNMFDSYIKESYASYENKPPAPANFDVNNGYTMPVCRQWKDDVLNNTQQFLKMQLFRAALTPELRKVVAQKDPNNMTLDDMYRITTDNQREAGPKIKFIS